MTCTLYRDFRVTGDAPVSVVAKSSSCVFSSREASWFARWVRPEQGYPVRMMSWDEVSWVVCYFMLGAGLTGIVGWRGG